MAVTKQYRIEIQMDDARAQLEAATRKLEQLDQQLAGVDKNSDVGKALVAEMARAAAEVDKLTNQVEGLDQALAGVKPPPPGTLAALRKEAEQLEEQLELTMKGTPERETIVRQLGQVKAELKNVDEAVDVAFDRDKAGAYVDAVAGIAGGFEVALVAAQKFGLSQKDAEKYQQQLTEMIAVVQGLESVHKLTTAEVSQALKGLWGDAKRVVLGYFGIGTASTAAGTAAVTSANVTRIALASLGIGLVLVVLGLVASNWDKITGAVKRNKDEVAKALAFIAPPLALLLYTIGQIEKKFGSVSSLVSGIGAAFTAGFRNIGTVIGKLLDGDFAGAAATYQNRGAVVAEAFHQGVLKKNQELAEERERALLKPIIEGRARRIAVLEAEGRDATGLKARQIADELKLIEVSNAEELNTLRNKYNELQVLEASFDKKRADDRRALDVATLAAEITRRSAHGENVLNLQLQQKELELQQLQTAVQRNSVAIVAKEAEVAAARYAIQKDAADKASALHLARLNAALTLEQAYGNDGVRVQLDIKRYELAQLLAAVQRNGAAIVAKRAEIQEVELAQERKAAEERQKISVERVKAFGGSSQDVLKAELGVLQEQQSALLLNGKKHGSEYLALQTQIRSKEKEIAEAGRADQKRTLDERAQQQQRYLDQDAEQEEIRLARLRRGGLTERQINQEALEGLKKRAQLMAQFGQTGTKAYSDLLDGINDLEKKLKPKAETLGDVILKALYPDASDEQIEEWKRKINGYYAQAIQSGQLLNDTLFSLAKDKTDAQIARYTTAMDAASQRAAQAEADLDAARQRREALEQNVDEARGARRQYLIEAIGRERAAEERAARQKAAADAEELKNQRLKEAAERRRQELERKSQILAAASATASNTAAAAEAIRAAVNAVSGANAVPFPGNLVAIVAALAATGAAIASAKQLGNTIKGAEGGLLVGPSHALGGIRGTSRFANVEVEGGEQLIRRSATANNLGTLATINKYGDRIQFAAVPRALMKGETGGRLSADGGLDVATASGGGVVAIPAAKFDQMIGLLERVAGASEQTAAKDFQPRVLPQDALGIARLARQEEDDMNAGRLFKTS